MKLRCKHRPHFSIRELGLLLGIALALVLLLVPMKAAISSVIKMPKPLPDIVKNYKSVYVHAGRPGMKNSGVHVRQGDYITILAEGTMSDYYYQTSWGPKSLLMYRLGERNSVRRYNGPELIKVPEDGGIYLGYEAVPPGTGTGGPLSVSRNFFLVDIIVWKMNDPNLIAKFLEEASLSQPKDKELKEIAQEFKKRQEIMVALQKKSKEVEEIKKELSIAVAQETPLVKKEEKKVEEAKVVTPPSLKEPIPEGKKPEKEKPIPEQKVVKKEEEKVVVTALKEKEPPAVKEDDKEKKIGELSEKLKKALQTIKELQEAKDLLASLESVEVEKSKQPKNLPVIAIGYPKDGISVDTEYVTLYGVTEHEKGISKFEVLVINKPMGMRDQGDVQIKPKDQKRIEFSEKIRLREGQNTIAVVVEGAEGLKTQKTLSVLLAKKREEVYAVVIGINKYKNFPSLKYAANDAREFYRYLTEVNQVPKDHVWLFLDEEAT